MKASSPWLRLRMLGIVVAGLFVAHFDPVGTGWSTEELPPGDPVRYEVVRTLVYATTGTGTPQATWSSFWSDRR